MSDAPSHPHAKAAANDAADGPVASEPEVESVVRAANPLVGTEGPALGPARSSARPLAPPPPPARRRALSSSSGTEPPPSARMPVRTQSSVELTAAEPPADLTPAIGTPKAALQATLEALQLPNPTAATEDVTVLAFTPLASLADLGGTDGEVTPNSSVSSVMASSAPLSGAPASMSPEDLATGPRARMAVAALPAAAELATETATARGPDDLPQQFGKYTLLRKLATGGMAELFLALQQSMAGFEKLVVVKRILPKMNQDVGFIEMLLNEARVAAAMSHPNIVQTFDVGEVDGVYFIAMEHVQGEDIRAIVRQLKKVNRNEFPLEHAVEIVRGLCSGLSYAHERCDLQGLPLNIVHRDISPQNVVITFSGDVKVVDFGIAQSDRKFATETGFGKLKGKIPYMSPEQARGLELDGRSDIFSAGVMLFELTTGRRLFKGESEYATLKLICESTYPLPTQLRPAYPPALELIVMRALAKDREQRYQSARELQSALEAFSREHHVATSSVALSKFMREIFAEELAAGRDAVLSDKKLAAEVLKLRGSNSDYPAAGIRGTLPSTSGIASERPAALDAPSTRAASSPDAQHSQPLSLPGRTASGATGDHTEAAYQMQRPRTRRRVYVLGAFIVAAAFVAGGAFALRSASNSAQLATRATGRIRIDSTPAGATVWVDGNMHNATTPTTLEGLPIDRDIKVRISKEGYDRAEETIRLLSTQPEASKQFALERGSLVIEWTVEPKSAALSIDNIVVESGHTGDLAADTDHVLVASAPGYEDERTTVRGGAHDTKHVDLVLRRVPNAGAAPTATTKPVTAATITSAKTGASATAPTAATSAPRVVTAPVGKGTLNVGASGGWCNVSVDGVGRGPTPVAGLELTAGAHSVTCTTSEGKSQSAAVIVPADGVARQRFTL